ncbi:MAG: hypothetical protein AAFS07_02075 [Pseudomonadota bacterium]
MPDWDRTAKWEMTVLGLPIIVWIAPVVIGIYLWYEWKNRRDD